MYNYKSFSLILESNRESKLKKQREKIHKFLWFEPIIDYVFEHVVDTEGTGGLQYTIWFCDKLKDHFITRLVNYTEDWDEYVDLLQDDEKYDFFDKYLKTGVLDLHIDYKSKHSTINEKEYERIKSDIAKRIYNSFTWITDGNLENAFNNILDWLTSPIREEQVNLSNYKTLAIADYAAAEWHKKLKATGRIANEKGKILLTFDDGYYWIDLQESSCRAEANAMGHCGTTHKGDTLLSLRKQQSPHITVAYDTINHIIYQMKGKNNTKPVEKYHPYIIKLLLDPKIDVKNFGYEYNRKEDFNLIDLNSEDFKKVFEEKPSLILESDDKVDLVKHALENKLLTKHQFLETFENIVDIDLFMFFIKLENETKKDANTDYYFTKEEINVMKENVNLEKLNELGSYILWSNKYFTTEEFVNNSAFDDLIIYDKKLCFYIDGWDHLDWCFDDTTISLLDGNLDWDSYYGYEMNRSDEIWDDVDMKTKEYVKDYLIEKEYTFSYEDESMGINVEDIPFTKTNLVFKKYSKTNDRKELYVIIKADDGKKYQIEFTDVLDYDKDGDLEEIWRAFERSINDLNDMLQSNATYRKAKDAIIDKFGSWEEIKHGKYKDKEGKEHDRYVYVFDTGDFFDKIEEDLHDHYTYDGETDYYTTDYGNLISIIQEFEYVEKENVDYNYVSPKSATKEESTEALINAIDSI